MPISPRLFVGRTPGGMSLSGKVPTAFVIASAVAWALLAPDSAQAQEEGPEWSNAAELTYLISGGNSVSSTLGVRNTLRRVAEAGELRVELATLRTESTRKTRRGIGQPDDFRIEEEEETVRTAERYAARTRYDHNLSPRTFASGSLGWERNTFGGFESRTIASLGGGTRWSRPDVWELKLGAGLTYTLQDDVVPDPTRSSRFAGLRATLDHGHQLATSTRLELKWVVDANVDEWSDVRGDFSQSVSAALSDRFALKTTLQLLVDNDPPLERIPLEAPDGTPTGETVVNRLKKLDRTISLALVVTL